jgi:hypothetical protein
VPYSRVKQFKKNGREWCEQCLGLREQDAFFLNCLYLADGTDRVFRNVGSQLVVYGG